jgi:excisionase family DNA binding protein
MSNTFIQPGGRGRDPQLVSLGVVAAARAVGVSERDMRSLIARGDVASFKSGRRRLILTSSLDEWATKLHAAPVQTDHAGGRVTF